MKERKKRGKAYTKYCFPESGLAGSLWNNALLSGFFPFFTASFFGYLRFLTHPLCEKSYAKEKNVESERYDYLNYLRKPKK